MGLGVVHEPLAFVRDACHLAAGRAEVRLLGGELALHLREGRGGRVGICLQVGEFRLDSTYPVLRVVDGLVGRRYALLAPLGGIGDLLVGRLDRALGIGERAGGIVRAPLGGLHELAIGPEAFLVLGPHGAELGLEL